MDDVARILAGERIDDLVARIEPMLLRRERERVFARLTGLYGLADELEPADRLHVLDELRHRHPEPPEELPPHRLRFAPVVLEQQSREPQRWIVAREQCLANRLALGQHLLCLGLQLARLRRLAPGDLCAEP